MITRWWKYFTSEVTMPTTILQWVGAVVAIGFFILIVSGVTFGAIGSGLNYRRERKRRLIEEKRLASTQPPQDERLAS